MTTINKKAQSGSIFSVLFFLIVMILVLIINSLGGTVGQHTGVVTAIEYNNNFLWDANIVYFKSSDQSTQEDRYCVKDEEVINKLRGYSQNKEIVTIFFQNDFILWRWECNGGISIIDKVEIQDGK